LYSNLCQEKYTSKRSQIGKYISRMGYIYTRIPYFGKYFYRVLAQLTMLSSAVTRRKITIEENRHGSRD
jgi:hypothetical protein